MGNMTKRVLCFDSSASTNKLSTHTHTNAYRFMLMKRDLTDSQTRDRSSCFGARLWDGHVMSCGPQRCF